MISGGDVAALEKTLNDHLELSRINLHKEFIRES